MGAGLASGEVALRARQEQLDGGGAARAWARAPEVEGEPEEAGGEGARESPGARSEGRDRRIALSDAHFGQCGSGMVDVTRYRRQGSNQAASLHVLVTRDSRSDR